MGTRRTRLAAVGTVVGLLVAVPLPALAQPPGQPAADPTPLFASSFEPTDPQPAWTSTVETDGAGNKKSSGIDGNSATRIPGSIDGQVTAIQASDENAPGGEVKQNLNDGDVNSKWLTFNMTGWVQYQLAKPVAVVDYALTSANDSPERDPRDWTLQGSMDGTTWTVLDTQAGQMFTDRFQTKTYHVANTTAYPFYKLDITANAGRVALLQLAEWQLSNGDTTPPPPSDMKSVLSKGPVSSPTAKSAVGFSGLRTLQISGRQLSDGRAYSSN